MVSEKKYSSRLAEPCENESLYELYSAKWLMLISQQMTTTHLFSYITTITFKQKNVSLEIVRITCCI